jgi:hypothetical protein
MKHIKSILMAFGLPAILTAYIIWTAWFQWNFERIPNTTDEEYFIWKHVPTILVFYYSILSAWVLFSLLPPF